MEKLIKLINKRQEETSPDGIYLPVVAYGDGIFWSDSDCLSSVMDEIHLISKSCRFILWLVENDKINLDEVERYSVFGYTYYQNLLMLLSISDYPIKDLISILK